MFAFQFTEIEQETAKRLSDIKRLRAEVALLIKEAKRKRPTMTEAEFDKRSDAAMAECKRLGIPRDNICWDLMEIK